jgi:hypothetical protein
MNPSDALAEFFEGKPVLVSSALAKTDVLWALLHLGEEAQRRCARWLVDGVPRPR